MKYFECNKCRRFIYTDAASEKIESMVFENKSLRQRLDIAKAELNRLRNALQDPVVASGVLSAFWRSQGEAVEPFCWIVVTDTGYVRYWSRNRLQAEKFADEKGVTLTALYTHQAPGADATKEQSNENAG